MEGILESLQGRGVKRFERGEFVIRQGEKTGCLFFLVEGSVEILKDDVSVGTTSQSGVVFGEMAAILGVKHTATVKAATDCKFYGVEGSDSLMEKSPEMGRYLCSILARRLDSVNSYLVKLKQSTEGREHLDPVIGALEALLQAQPGRPRGGKQTLL
jgi:CRP-like cAMP-binding protein